MTTPATLTDHLALHGRPTFAGPFPLLNEAEEEDSGSSDPHFWTVVILAVGIVNHLASRPPYRVFADLNFYIHPGPPVTSVTPDVMVVMPGRDLGEDVSAYHLGIDGPPPVLVVEVLSESTARDRDLGVKIQIYAQLGVAEYILVDPRGRWLPQRLLLKRLQGDGSYQDFLDKDGGVSSNLGFRLFFEADGGLAVFDMKTGRRYARATQAEHEAKARRQAEEKIRQDSAARLVAEEKQREHTAARLAAEEEIRAIQAEIQRLRQAAEQPPAHE